MKKLSAQGKETQELLVTLFKGYKQCKYSEFVEYTIVKKEGFYEEGEHANYQQFTDRAVNREETIITLKAQINQ
jgi:hypothetical protein